jgi:PAS domain S-box-containing protein
MSSHDPDSVSFQKLAEQAPIMIWMSGHDLGCFYFNRAWLNFTGRTLAQEYGNGWAEGVHPDDLEQCVAHYISCFNARAPFAMNYRLRHFTGAYYWILDRGSPHYSADGRFLGYFGGCAETGDISPALLNADLRTSLAAVEEFARVFASGHLPSAPRDKDASPQLAAFAEELRRDHTLHSPAAKHARGQILQLARDMMTYRALPQGARLR